MTPVKIPTEIAELERELAIWKRMAGADAPKWSEHGQRVRRHYLKARKELYPEETAGKARKATHKRRLRLRLRKIERFAADTRGNANMRNVAVALAAKLRDFNT